MIRVAAICGSLRKASFNRFLIRAAIEICEESIEGLVIEDIDITPLPFLNTDLVVDGVFPPEVEAFREKIRSMDAVLFAAPEYNYSVSAPLKNAIDWASRPPNAWADKAAAIITAAGGSGGVREQCHLRQIGVYIDLHFINKPEFFMRRPYEPPQKFDSDGKLIDEDVRQQLRAILVSLHTFTLLLRGGKGSLKSS